MTKCIYDCKNDAVICRECQKKERTITFRNQKFKDDIECIKYTTKKLKAQAEEIFREMEKNLDLEDYWYRDKITYLGLLKKKFGVEK